MIKRRCTSVVLINGKLYGRCITKLNGESLFDLSSTEELEVFKDTANRWCGEPVPSYWRVGDELPDLFDRDFDIARNNAMSFVNMRRNYTRNNRTGRY